MPHPIIASFYITMIQIYITNQTLSQFRTLKKLNIILLIGSI